MSAFNKSKRLNMQKIKIEAKNNSFKNGAMRSCWNCNEAHGYLKKTKWILHCYVCGEYYYNGIKLKNIRRKNDRKCIY